MKKWLSMLVAAGTVTLGVVVWTVMVPREDATRAELIDAGIFNDCSVRRADCSFLWRDNYVHKMVPVLACPDNDGGPDVIVVPRKLAGAIQNFDAQCTRRATCNGCDGGAANLDVDVSDEADVTPDCRCRGVGLCRFLDAGQTLKDTTYDSSEVAGPGCVPKACVEVAGYLSMPEECR